MICGKLSAIWPSPGSDLGSPNASNSKRQGVRGGERVVVVVLVIEAEIFLEIVGLRFG